MKNNLNLYILCLSCTVCVYFTLACQSERERLSYVCMYMCMYCIMTKGGILVSIHILFLKDADVTDLQSTALPPLPEPPDPSDGKSLMRPFWSEVCVFCL